MEITLPVFAHKDQSFSFSQPAQTSSFVGFSHGNYQTSQPTVFSSHKKPAPASPNQHQPQPANRPDVVIKPSTGHKDIFISFWLLLSRSVYIGHRDVKVLSILLSLITLKILSIVTNLKLIYCISATLNGK